MVVVDILGVVKVFPAPKKVPPVIAEYQLITEPASGVALKVTVPVPQLLPPVGLVTCGLYKVRVTTLESNEPPAEQLTVHL